MGYLGAAPAQPEDFQEVLGRGHREKCTAHMVAGIANEKLGSDGSGDEAMAKSSMPKAHRTHRGHKAHAPTTTPIATDNPFEPLTIEEASDAHDDDYAEKSSLASTTDTEIEEITNEEVSQFYCQFGIMLIQNLSIARQ